MKIIAVIPAKMGAKRFPGKPLAPIRDLPMVSHIYERAKLAKNIDGCFVASHDEPIKLEIENRGGVAIMENNTEKNAVAGLISALPEIINNLGYVPDRIIMIQGDEPMVRPELLDEMAQFLRSNPDKELLNVIDLIRNDKELNDPNIVKVILNQNGEGMWFFRRPAPNWEGKLEKVPIYKQTGIIAFSYNYLTNPLPGRTPMESAESVDMFRLIEHGRTVPIIESEYPLYSVDTEEDRIFVENLMKEDQLIEMYAKKSTD